MKTGREECWEPLGKVSSGLMKESKRWSFASGCPSCQREELAAEGALIAGWRMTPVLSESPPATALLNWDNKLAPCSSLCESLFGYMQPQEHQN